MISKTKYFSSYDSPNIVIVPTCNENMPPLKRTKTNNDLIENTQIPPQDKTVTVADGNFIHTMSMQNNEASENHLNSNNIPSINSKYSENQIREEIPKKQLNESDSFKTTNNYVKEELSQVSCVKNSEGALTGTIYLNGSIDKSSEKFAITSRTVKKPLHESEGCIIKHNICTNTTDLPDNKMKNETKAKTSEKFIDMGEHSGLKENENKQKLECNENKMVKSDEQAGDIDKSSPHFKNETTIDVCNIDKNTINHNVHLPPKKSNLYRPNKEKVEKHKVKAKNQKIIKIVINVTYNNPHENKNTKTKKLSEHDKNPDLSFLDDFDVDEVVESLISCKNTKEDINESIKCDIDNASKKSPTIFTAENINKEEKHNLKVKADLVKNRSMVCNIYAKEVSKDFSNNNNNNITVNEDQNIRNTVNIKKECFLNEYLRKGILFRILETKICALFMKKYSIDTVAHCGKFSKIFKCTDMVTGENYGIKMFNECDPYNGIREQGILQEINKDIPKENLSCIFLMHTFKLDHHWCFMTHYYTINLQQVLQIKRKSFHIDEIRNLSMQLVSALIIIRSKNIVHSDIKPSHILLNRELKELKLCGFDEAYYYNDYNYSSPNMGTVNYRAPELILGYSNGYSIDIWSMALVMYEMVTNNTLFSGETNYEILYKQISIFGNLPSSMIIGSRFSKDYFVGTNLVANTFVVKEKDTINHFKNDEGLQKMIMDIYKKHWSGNNTKKENLKLNSFCSLLKKMFILDPKHRLPIEYVYANTFFSAK